MLKAEIRKIFKEAMIYVVLGGIVLALGFVTVFYASNRTLDSFKHYGYQIQKYETREDVQALQEQAETELREGDLEPETVREYKRTIQVYEYLQNKEFIEYDSLVDYLGLNAEKYSNQYSFARYAMSLMSIVVSVLFGIMASTIVTMDFQTGMQKVVYSRNCKRRKIVTAKYLSWFFLAVAACVVTSLFIGLFGLAFGNGGIQSILYASSSGAFTAPYFSLMALEFVSLLLRTVVYGTIAFGISLFCRNILSALISNVAMYGLVFACYQTSVPLLNNLAQGIFSVFEYSGSRTINILYVLLIYVVVAVAALIAGNLYFSKKDIK